MNVLATIGQISKPERPWRSRSSDAVDHVHGLRSDYCRDVQGLRPLVSHSRSLLRCMIYRTLLRFRACPLASLGTIGQLRGIRQHAFGTRHHCEDRIIAGVVHRERLPASSRASTKSSGFGMRISSPPWSWIFLTPNPASLSSRLSGGASTKVDVTSRLIGGRLRTAHITSVPGIRVSPSARAAQSNTSTGAPRLKCERLRTEPHHRDRAAMIFAPPHGYLHYRVHSNNLLVLSAATIDPSTSSKQAPLSLPSVHIGR